MAKSSGDVTGIILAGGKSSRMGQNKALLEIDGKRIIDGEVSLFRSIFKEIILVTNTPSEYEYLDVKTVTDIFPDKGSLGGIYTGLFHSTFEYSFIVSCDMPFLKRELIEYLISLKNGADAVVPKLRNGYEPLHALYSKKCLKPIEEMIKKGDLRIKSLFQTLKVKEVPEQEIVSLNPAPSSFLNVNTPEDYKEAISASSAIPPKQRTQRCAG